MCIAQSKNEVLQRKGGQIGHNDVYSDNLFALLSQCGTYKSQDQRQPHTN